VGTLLSDPDPIGRIAGASQCGEKAMHEYMGLVQAMLSDPDDEVRDIAEETLYRLKTDLALFHGTKT